MAERRSELVHRGLVKIVIVHSSSKVDFYNYYYEVVKFRDPNPPVLFTWFRMPAGALRPKLRAQDSSRNKNRRPEPRQAVGLPESTRIQRLL